MRALSIRQPFAWAIEQGFKTVENRSRAISLKLAGPIAIHATKWRNGTEFLDSALFIHRACGKTAVVGGLTVGGIIAVADVVGCIQANSFGKGVIVWALPDYLPHVAQATESPFFVGPFGWVLANVRAVPFHPCKDSLGFFNVELPEQ